MYGTLLIVVCVLALFAIYHRERDLPLEVRQVERGMSPGKVVEVLGGPNHQNEDGDFWTYRYEWGELFVVFSPDADECDAVAYKPNGKPTHLVASDPMSLTTFYD